MRENNAKSIERLWSLAWVALPAQTSPTFSPAGQSRAAQRARAAASGAR
jgi:hypothetical protein